MISTRTLHFVAAALVFLLWVSVNATAQEATVTPVYTFAGAAGEGIQPSFGIALLEARNGSFYGVTQSGGAAGLGTIFRMMPDGTTTTVHSFDRPRSQSGLVEGRDGNLYGVTGGNDGGLGGVFRLTTDGDFSEIHTFSGAPAGAHPRELLAATDGYLYGTTGAGGSANLGTIFKISLDGTLSTMHSFSGTPDGAEPAFGLTEGADGNFYGMTRGGGPTGNGTFFRMTADGDVTSVDIPPFTATYASRLVLGLDGNFYTVAVNTIYRVTPSGVLTPMAHLEQATFSLLQSSDGHLYGSSFVPGCFPLCPNQYFRTDLQGHLELVKEFEDGGRTNGWMSALIEARDGNLYGTWSGGSAFPFGAVVRMSNYTNCNDKLTVRYEQGTLHLGFTLMTKTPGTFHAWLATPGPPVRVAPLWSVPIPAVTPAVSADVPVPGFPNIGKFFVLTALTTEAGPVCADWKLLDTGAAAPSE